MFDFLEGFQDRMEFAAIVDSIVNRKNTNTEIESWFEKDELDNLFFSLLVYIMEQTLNENNDCTMDNIAIFLDDILPYYNKDISFDQVEKLSEYMIKDILQNKGLTKTYGTMNYSKSWDKVRIRLISDKISDDGKITYQLTDQGYNYLFRTKEVDKELDFKLEQLKLRELLKRKNYKHALNQSKQLISTLRQKKRDVDEFINRVRRNIHDVNRNEYEKLIKETYSLIDEEYEGMLDLKEVVIQDKNRINKEIEENGYIDDTMKNALKNLDDINRNLQVVIAEQRNLIGKRFSMNDIYEETIKSSFFSSIVKRFDFEKEIISPFEDISEKEISRLWKLMTPLYGTKLKRLLNLSLIYQRQGKLRESGENDESAIDNRLEEDKSLEKIKEQNDVNYGIIESLFKYASKVEKSEFTFSDYYNHIAENPVRLDACVKDKRIFLIMLKLYEIGLIDINEWKKRDKEDAIAEANGEFDLAWCLNKLENKQEDYFNIGKISIEKAEIKMKVCIEEKFGDETVKSTIEMNDFRITPVMARGEEDD
jgi:hypothetical protein